MEVLPIVSCSVDCAPGAGESSDLNLGKYWKREFIIFPDSFLSFETFIHSFHNSLSTYSVPEQTELDPCPYEARSGAVWDEGGKTDNRQ